MGWEVIFTWFCVPTTLPVGRLRSEVVRSLPPEWVRPHCFDRSRLEDLDACLGRFLGESSTSVSHGASERRLGTVTTDLTWEVPPGAGSSKYTYPSGCIDTESSDDMDEVLVFSIFLCLARCLHWMFFSERSQITSSQLTQATQLSSRVYSGLPSLALHDEHISFVSNDARKWLHLSKVLSLARAFVADSWTSLIFPAKQLSNNNNKTSDKASFADKPGKTALILQPRKHIQTTLSKK